MSHPLPPKSFGAPVPTGAGVPTRLGQVLVGARGVTFAWTFQLVAQRASSNGEPIGSPVFQRKIPASCHPPRTACRAGLSVFTKVLPLPNGNCHTAEALMRCRMSKSEFP